MVDLALNRHSKRNTLNMTKAKTKANPVEDEWTLDDYLGNKFTYGIYDELTDKDSENFELFEPLEFFRVFYLSVEEIEQGKAKPLTVSKVLKNDLCLYGDQKLTDEQRYFFYEKIFDYYSNLRYEDEQIDICCREILKLQENLDVYGEDEEIETPKQKDAFAEILEHCETLPSNKEKIAFLLKEKTKDAQNHTVNKMDFSFVEEKTIAEKCELEINKLRELMKLEESQNNSKNGIMKHKDLTIDRAILLMKSLAPRLTGCDQNKVADVIAFLTSFESESIRINFSEIKNKFANKPEAYNKDVKIVCEYLNLIGLTNEAEKLKRDSGVI